MREPASLLHNMSAPSQTVVSYAGLRRFAAPAGQTADDRPIGVLLRFALPDAMTARTAASVLRTLRVRPGPDADRTLAALIDKRAAELQLPDGCLVVPGPTEATPRILWPDLLSTLAVLTKCSAHVWLRAKNPSLGAALSRREVLLYVPPSLEHLLPKENA